MENLSVLAGIEAPAPAQPCYREDGRRWNCASAARSGLGKIVRAHKVTCTSSGQDDAGRTLANCLLDGSKNIAAEVVRAGYVFATDNSFFSTLSGEESAGPRGQARHLARRSDPPAEWRDQTWETAKREAPDGCPIKGVVRRFHEGLCASLVRRLRQYAGPTGTRRRCLQRERCQGRRVYALGQILKSGLPNGTKIPQPGRLRGKKLASRLGEVGRRKRAVRTIQPMVAGFQVANASDSFFRSRCVCFACPWCAMATKHSKTLPRNFADAFVWL